MWHILMILALASLGGLYATLYNDSVLANENAGTVVMARDMAHYREAVITYFNQNPSIYQSVALATLRDANVVPTWSTLFQRPSVSTWANYRDTDGMIYVFAQSLPPANLLPELMKLTQDSVMVGVYRPGDTTLYSPIFGDTKRKLPSTGSVSIPAGSPVWIAVGR